ncbi:hypothetical protein FRC14_007875 [Serendipita sp. 396]|nr:hypothetical protein FRC14_007875 [Serendipita sp. 396]KAG8789059.1 hypothetical protein FRC15_000115 [Serendipita sp. 397]KAG8804242.1 hypothetical protein FRC16_011101 [Serendipita sp. 398]KAG8827644.1 hypothetical protein FRC19_001889 [Serendipita sp. 401]KAG8877001.1 hypothetical protein FRC20_000118 [Serendipita sp. 405]KAG9058024.1 hypothetical protein FS842_001985 [Serendipita sp. 407]
MSASPKRRTPDKHAKAKEAADAKQISQRIDAMLEAERAAIAKHAGIVKILLLGQSESGKSTVLKNFQLMYAREKFAEDRANWKGVVLLNVVRCMQRVVDALIQADAAESEDSADELPPDAPPPLSSILTDSHRRRCTRLRATLDLAERGLKARLSPTYAATANLPRSRPSTAEGLVDEEAEAELAVPANSWTLGPQDDTTFKPSSSRRLSALPQHFSIDNSDPNDPRRLIGSCRQDMINLWNDPAVKEILIRRKVKWLEWPGFFLNDIERVTSEDYIPTDDDVVRARLKTMGISDYSFEIDRGPRGTFLWRIFDVGGSRTQRNQWIPYFEDTNAVIFLAPLSSFDQKLAEDRSVNRLEDSLLLWKSVCANRLLASVDFILFLNKIDILSAKLRSGVKVQKYVRSFRDRPNTAEAAAKYFKEKFHGILREYSPRKRPFYCYLTSAIDTKATNAILDNVGESILRKNLQNLGVL